MQATRGFAFCVVIALAPLPAPAAPPPPIRPGSPQALSTCEGSASPWYASRSRFYSAASQDIPAALVPALGKDSHLAIRTCTDFDGNAHFFVRTPTRSQDGVCQVFENEIFPAEGRMVPLTLVQGEFNFLRLSGFTRAVPQAWSDRGYTTRPDDIVLAQLAPEPCPDGSDSHYLITVNVAPGLFKMAMQAFADARTEDGFARVFTGSPDRGVPDPRRVLATAGVTSMVCRSGGCSAGLTTGGNAQFDLHDGHVVITRVFPYID